MADLTVFLDSNVLFSAALGGPAFRLIWDLEEAGRIRLVTSLHCRVEAAVNLERKRPAVLSRLEELLSPVKEVAEGDEGKMAIARRLLPEKDARVLAAALATGASVLLTGDRKHFGPLMDRSDLKIRIRTPRQFLLEGP